MTDTDSQTPLPATADQKPLWRRLLGPFGNMKRGPLLLLFGTVLILISTGGAVGASKIEEDDKFCTTCHLAPERTYYNRAQYAMDHQDDTIPDLATFHYVDALNNISYDEFRCVDCHRGRQNVVHRGAALVLGAYDGLKYALGGGSATEIEKGEVHQEWLINASCIDCHTDTLLLLGFDNHFHNYMEAARDAYDDTGNLFVPEGTPYEDEVTLLDEGLHTFETDTNCLTCHLAHVSVVGGERVQFIDEDTKLNGCDMCHVDNDLDIDLLEQEGQGDASEGVPQDDTREEESEDGTDADDTTQDGASGVFG